MAQKKIFIGCATESKATAQQIAQTLAKEGLKPCRWWKEFSSGEYTLDRLLKISREVDGAILLCTPDDTTWFRGKETDVPRDNCVLEYGLFVSNLGPRHTYLLANPECKLPSDVNGLTLASLNPADIESTAEEAATYFNRLFANAPKNSEYVHFVAAPEVLNARIEGPDPAWLSRSLYLGDEGAANWLSVVNDPEYLLPTFDVKQQRLDALSKTDTRTFVSLGPGDAEADVPLISVLRNKEPLLEYIPIDICNSLLERTVNRLRQDVRIPIAIVADIEEGHAFIESQLDGFGKRPMLFSMLGATMGNLDRGELGFLSRAKTMMKLGDWLIFDAGLAGPNWDAEHESRLTHSAYKEKERWFLAAGICKRTRESPEGIVDAFDERVLLTLETSHGSDVPNTQTVRVSDHSTGQTILYNRRYCWESFLSMLTDQIGFEVVCDSTSFDDNESLGMGTVLVRKK